MESPQMNGALTRRESFDSQEIESTGETASTAIAEQAKAAVQARYVMAIRKPRDMEFVRQRILKECQRPTFAETSRFSKPMGGSHVEGWSIRFAEAALRLMGNSLIETSIIYEDTDKRIVRVSVTDLETNTTYPNEILIQKSVERNSVKEGQTVLGQRVNSRGRLVYLVEATEDELLVKQAALVSKAIRTNALRLIPGDILDEAEALVADTLKNRDARDPDSARRSIIDSFARIGIGVEHLAQYLGHPLDTVLPEELLELRRVGLAVKEKETTWAEALAAKLAERGEETAKPKAADALKQKLAEKQKTDAPATGPAERRATTPTA